jgi:hypothetical protein
MGKPVLCPACNKQIHIDEWGGVVNVDGKARFIHNNFICLMWLAKRMQTKDAVSEVINKEWDNKHDDISNKKSEVEDGNKL